MKPRTPVRREIDDMLDEIEKKQGAVPPVVVMFLARSYQALEATNRAQRAMIAEYGEELRILAKVRKSK